MKNLWCRMGIHHFYYRTEMRIRRYGKFDMTVPDVQYELCKKCEHQKVSEVYDTDDYYPMLGRAEDASKQS